MNCLYLLLMLVACRITTEANQAQVQQADSDPCENVSCPPGQECTIKTVHCTSGKCPDVPHCVTPNPTCPIPTCGPKCRGLWSDENNCIHCLC